MFLMSSACCQNNRHIRQRSACEDSPVYPLKHVGSYQILIVLCQLVQRALAPKLNSAPSLPRLEPERHLRIMPERLVVTVAHNRPPDRFLINYLGRKKGDVNSPPLSEHLFYNLKLYFTHNRHSEGRKRQAELRLLLFQQPHIPDDFLHRLCTFVCKTLKLLSGGSCLCFLWYHPGCQRRNQKKVSFLHFPAARSDQ